MINMCGTKRVVVLTRKRAGGLTVFKINVLCHAEPLFSDFFPNNGLELVNNTKGVIDSVQRCYPAFWSSLYYKFKSAFFTQP